MNLFLTTSTSSAASVVSSLTDMASSAMVLFTKEPINYFFYAGLVGIVIGIVKKLKH